MKTIVYQALIGATVAIQLNREPLLSQDASPLLVHQSPKYWDTLVDYPVADFGKSHEIMYTQNNIKQAEAASGKPWVVAKDAAWPAGVDTNVEFKLLQTDSSINREPLLSANASPLEIQQKPAYADHAIDYFVPDFGVSHEIMYTENNIANAEKEQKHKFNASFGATKSTVDTPRNYVVPDFGVDRDIMSSLSNLEAEEKKIGVWSLDGQTPKANPPTNAKVLIEKTKTEVVAAEPFKDITEPGAPVPAKIAVVEKENSEIIQQNSEPADVQDLSQEFQSASME